MRKQASAFISGVAVGITAMVGCATAFPYRYYATSMPPSCYDLGQLLGKTGSGGWPDASLDQCKPDPDLPPGSPSGAPQPVKLKCMTMLVDDFYSLKADDEKCHADLQICQQGPQPQ